MVVVLSALVINTVVDKGPIIFLKLGELEGGESDGMIHPTERDKDWFDGGGRFVNYTKVMNEVTNNKYNLSPRKQFGSSDFAYGNTQYSGTLVVLDTKREKDIKIGIKYKFDPMQEGECLINERLKSALKVGQDE